MTKELIRLTSIDGEFFYISAERIDEISPTLGDYKAKSGVFVGGQVSYCMETVEQIIDALNEAMGFALNVIEVGND